MQNKSIIIILAVIIIFALAGAGYYFYAPDAGTSLKGQKSAPPQGRVIEEKLVIPDTKSITGSEGRIVNQGVVGIALAPKDDSEKVIVPGAALTVKGSYALAALEAVKWSGDARLVFVKSLGAVTLEGKSSQWQVAFSSSGKKGKGYEVIIQGDTIVSQKEIAGTAVSGELPKNWKDAGDIIQELQSHPLYQDATISRITFYFQLDNKKWYYAFSTSKGTSSIAVE